MAGNPLDYASSRTRDPDALPPAPASAIVGLVAALAAWLALFVTGVHAAANGDPLADFTLFRAYHIVIAFLVITVASTTIVALFRSRRHVGWVTFFILGVSNALVFAWVSLWLMLDIRADAFPLNTNWPLP